MCSALLAGLPAFVQSTQHLVAWYPLIWWPFTPHLLQSSFPSRSSVQLKLRYPKAWHLKHLIRFTARLYLQEVYPILIFPYSPSSSAVIAGSATMAVLVLWNPNLIVFTSMEWVSLIWNPSFLANSCFSSSLSRVGYVTEFERDPRCQSSNRVFVS